jgi:uncharacterized protein with PQ loop repeat
MIYIVGIIGSILLSICSYPEVVRTIKLKHAGMGYGILLTWLSGCICSAIYQSTIHNPVVIASTLSNLLAVSIITYYKVKYK